MAKSWKRQGPSMLTVVPRDLRLRAHYATDRATSYALKQTRSTIRSVGLGRLALAVGSYSSVTEEDTGKPRAYGAIFARGPAAGRGNQALLAYSGGATIYPTAGKSWLAFPTKAIPQRAGRYKMTPARYRAAGLEQSIGKLRFVPGKGGKEAYLVASKVTVSRRTGRAKAYDGKVPRGSDRKSGVIAFILIRYTARARRFDQKAIMRDAAAQIPRFASLYKATLA